MAPKRRQCEQCQLISIQGVVCHESGCPDAWKDEIRECKECGVEFEPESQHDAFCDTQCNQEYHGIVFVD